MRMSWRPFVALVVAVGSMGSAEAQASRPYLVVASGQALEVARYSSINPDCSSMGAAQVNLIEAARAGEVRVGSGRRYMAFSPNNPRSACNRRRVPTTIVTYRSAKGFVGQDTFVIGSVDPTGVGQRAHITVNVR